MRSAEGVFVAVVVVVVVGGWLSVVVSSSGMVGRTEDDVGGRLGVVVLKEEKAGDRVSSKNRVGSWRAGMVWFEDVCLHNRDQWERANGGRLN